MRALLDSLASMCSKGKTMKTLKTITFLIAVPVGLAGCDQFVTDMGYGDVAQPDRFYHYHARDMAVSGFGCETCDFWNYKIDRNVYPEGEPDFSCTTAYNLAKMVDNRNDLMQGRTLASTDSTRSDLVTQYLREDKTKQLLKLEKILQ